MRCLLFLALLWLGAPASHGQNNNDLPPGVEVKSYTGWDNSIFLNASERPVQAVVVPTVGGRLAHYSWDGQNILLENSASLGRTLGEKKEDLLLGGFQCDVGGAQPETDQHFQLTEGKQHWKSEAPFSVKVSSEADAALGVVLEKEFVLAGDTGELGIVQRIRNTSDKDETYRLLDRTLCKGGGFVLLPLNKKSRFKASWSQVRETAGTRYLDGDHPNSAQETVLDGVLVAQTGGDSTRFGADSDAEWIAYTRGKLLFIKYFEHTAGGDYGPGGNTVEVYSDRRVTELDLTGPLTTVKAGQTSAFLEKWALVPLDKEISTPDEARRLVRKIPSFHFKSPK